MSYLDQLLYYKFLEDKKYIPFLFFIPDPKRRIKLKCMGLGDKAELT